MTVKARFSVAGAALLLASLLGCAEGPPPPAPPPRSLRVATVHPCSSESTSAECEVACEHGDASSCATLGDMKAHGNAGAAIDLTRAAELYDRACRLGSMSGCGSLGVAYFRGEGVSVDRARAHALFQKACDEHVASACGNFGLDLAETDPGRAIQPLTVACSAGYGFACERAGELYREGKNGISTDNGLAARFFEKACTQRDVTGCANFAVLLHGGDGVAKDLSRAGALIERACAAGQGCTTFGLWLVTGNGVQKDLARGLSLLEGECERGDGTACEAGALTYLGEPGFRPDFKRAADLSARACSLGESEACKLVERLKARVRNVAMSSKIAGFHFGMTKGEAEALCKRAGNRTTTTRIDFIDVVTCSGVAESVGFSVSSVDMSLCGGRICSIQLFKRVSSDANASARETEYAELLDRLARRYGPPNEEKNHFPDACQNPTKDCFADGPFLRASWFWFNATTDILESMVRLESSGTEGFTVNYVTEAAMIDWERKRAREDNNL